jgi:Zn-dependent peptidase ImmA (M78 family)
MRRGFKAEAERRATAARQSLGLGATAPIDPWKYAEALKVSVFQFDTLDLNDGASLQLTITDADSWSAMTLASGETHAIVLNPAHAKTRQRNDLMHELSHIDLCHAPSRVEVSPTGLLLLSDYSEEQEQEADWLAATMLLPRDGLIVWRSKGAQSSEIADYYGVSVALTGWRLRTTGIDVQLRYRGLPAST